MVLRRLMVTAIQDTNRKSHNLASSTQPLAHCSESVRNRVLVPFDFDPRQLTGIHPGLVVVKHGVIRKTGSTYDMSDV